MEIKNNYSLTATNSQTNSTATVNSDIPEDLVRLLQLCGQNADSFTFNASSFGSQQDQSTTVTQNQSMSLQTKNAEDVMRLLQLSGIKSDDDVDDVDDVEVSDQVKPCGCVGDCEHDAKPCGCGGNCQCNKPSTPEYGSTEVVQMAEQQAEYDYGSKDVDEDQDTFDIKDYNWRGQVDLPERLTSARFGSNPLASNLPESIHAKLLSAYKDFLEESSDIDDASGILSPLTANSRNEFDKDPLADEEADTDGSESPLSRIERQHIPR